VLVREKSVKLTDGLEPNIESSTKNTAICEKSQTDGMVHGVNDTKITHKAATLPIIGIRHMICFQTRSWPPVFLQTAPNLSCYVRKTNEWLTFIDHRAWGSFAQSRGSRFPWNHLDTLVKWNRALVWLGSTLPDLPRQQPGLNLSHFNRQQILLIISAVASGINCSARLSGCPTGRSKAVA